MPGSDGDGGGLPDRREIWAEAVFEGRARCAVEVKGGHSLISDEPAGLAGGLGGENAGPTPLGLVAAGFAADIPVIIARIADEMGIEIAEMSARASIVFDPRGIKGLEGFEPTPFEAVSDIHLTCTAGDAEIEALKAAYIRRCPVYNILRNSGCRMIDNWSVKAP